MAFTVMPARADSSARGESEIAGFGSGVVSLAELPFLTVDGRYIDNAAELTRPHALDHRATHIEQCIEIGGDHGIPLLPGHLMQGAVADDPGIIDQDFDGPGRGLDLSDAFGASFEAADVPAIDVDPRLGAESVGGGDVARISRGHAIAGFGERLGNSGTNPACSTRDQCNPCHLPFLD